MRKVILGVFLIAGGIYSCQKSDVNNDSDLTSNLEMASADVLSTQLSEASSSDIQSVSIESFESSEKNILFDLNRKNWRFDGLGPVRFGIPHIDSCATVTVSSAVYPKIITIDYGSGCFDRKGHVKKGKIIIQISDTIITEGATRTIAYENFSIDSVSIELTATLKNLGRNESGNWLIERKSEQTVNKNGETSKQIVTETIEWVGGFETTDKDEDIYYKSGVGTITLNDTLTYSRTITTPLLVDRTCGYIKSGTIELFKNSSAVVVDYGDGTCDSKATVTTNGVSEEIDLRHSKYNSDSLFGKHSRGFGHKKGKGKG